MGEVLVLLTGDTSCDIQGLRSSENSIISIQHGKVSCMVIVSVNRHLIRYLENRLSPGHFEVAFWIIKSLGIHEIILRYQESALGVRHEDNSALQDLNILFVVNHFIVNGFIMNCFRGGTNSVH